MELWFVKSLKTKGRVFAYNFWTFRGDLHLTYLNICLEVNLPTARRTIYLSLDTFGGGKLVKL